MTKKINLSLTKKYLSVSVIGLLAIVITFTIINTNYQNINLLDQHLKRAENLLNILEVSTAEDLYSLRLDHLRQTINFIKKDESVVSVLILDKSDMVVTDGIVNSPLKNQSISDPLLDEALLTDKIKWEIRNRDIHLFAPVKLPNIRLGAIKLIYSLDELRAAEISILYNNLKFGFIIFIVAFLLIAFFVKKIVGPIKQLTKATLEVATGNYDKQITINTRDELETLTDSFNEMVREVKISRDEMVEAKNIAEASDRLKTEFLAQISHEIRTPINAIVNFTSLLKAEFEYKMYGDVKESFEIIEHSSARLIRTIDLIINMSELQTGSYKSNFEQVELFQDIVSPVISEFKPFASEKGINIISETIGSPLLLNGDRYSLVQLFSNLIDNAIKYTNSGEVKITLEKLSSGEIIVNVSDTGIGIAEEFMPFIFEPFMQENRGYSRKYDGTGLGLALVKRYCDINNATIEISTSKNKGTIFTISFLQNTK